MSQKQNIDSLSIQEKKSLHQSTRLEVADEVFQSQKLYVNKKLSSDKEKSEYLSQTSKEHTVSESLSDKHVDVDVKRQTQVNVKGNTESVGKLTEENLRERGKKVIYDKNMKLKHQSSEEIEAKLLNEDVPVRLMSGKRGVQTATPSESSSAREGNCVATNDRPEEIKIQKKIEVQGLEDEFTELQISITHGKSTCDLKVYEKTSCPELDDTFILEDPNEFEGNFDVSEPTRSSTPVLSDSLQIDSREPEIKSNPNFLLTSGSNNCHELATMPPLLLMECNSLATPAFNQSEGRDKIVNLDPSTIFSAKPLILSQEVMPQVSEDDGDQNNNKLTEERNAENNVGFDDASEETSCPELDDTFILEDPSQFEGSFEVFEPRRSSTPELTDSLQIDSREPEIKSNPNFLLTSGSNDGHELATMPPLLFMEGNSSATPGFNQSEGRDKTVNLDYSTIFSAKPILSQEVMHLPQVSGNDGDQNNNKLTEERNAENNVGFDDASEETSCPELDDTFILEDPSQFEGSLEVFEPRRSSTPELTDSLQIDSREPEIKSNPNLLLTSGSNYCHEFVPLRPTAEIRISTAELSTAFNWRDKTPTLQNAPNQRRLLMECNSLATPGFNQSEGRDETVTLDSPSTIFSAEPPSFLSQEVMQLPRENGDADIQDYNKLTEERNVENNFGFDDTSEGTKLLPSMSVIPLKQRLRKTTLASSTPLQKSKNKLKHSSLCSKMKPLTPAISQLARELPKSNFKIKDKAAQTPRPDRLKTCTSAKLSHFSNVLKQRKLDLTPNSSKSATDETSKHKNGDTPLSFKYAEDNTPTHFKEPPGRSDDQSVKRKMKPLGGGSEEEEEEENRTKSTQT